MTKKIYFDAKGPVHSQFREFVEFPPDGYRYILNGAYFPSQIDKGHDYPVIYKSLYGLSLRNSKMANLIARLRLKTGDPLVRRKVNAELTFSPFHLIYRREPWVICVEHLGSILPRPYDIPNLSLYRKFVEKVLALDYCKRIMPYWEASKKTITENLNCKRFVDKIQVVPLAVRPKSFVKQHDSEKVRLLFVGSVNIREGRAAFDGKGGKEVLEVFSLLNKSYGKKTELIIRCHIPPLIKERYREVLKLSNVKLIETTVSVHHLDRIFKEADIFLFPGHVTPAMAFLDAMSYGLPIVTTDVFANPEMVENGKNGFLVKELFPIDNFNCNWKLIRITHEEMIREIAEKTRILIDDPIPRRKMGDYGRALVEHGRFSLKFRNQMLKEIFDEAIG